MSLWSGVLQAYYFLRDTMHRLFQWNVSSQVEWEKAMAPYSSTLAWKIPWTEEPDRLQSMGSQRVGHD